MCQIQPHANKHGRSTVRFRLQQALGLAHPLNSLRSGSAFSIACRLSACQPAGLTGCASVKTCRILYHLEGNGGYTLPCAISEHQPLPEVLRGRAALPVSLLFSGMLRTGLRLFFRDAAHRAAAHARGRQSQHGFRLGLPAHGLPAAHVSAAGEQHAFWGGCFRECSWDRLGRICAGREPEDARRACGSSARCAGAEVRACSRKAIAPFPAWRARCSRLRTGARTPG